MRHQRLKWVSYSVVVIPPLPIYLQYVRVIPAIGTTIVVPVVVEVCSAYHADPTIFNILFGAPTVTHSWGPCGRVIYTPLTHRIENVSASFIESLLHDWVTGLKHYVLAVTVIILKVVYLSLCIPFSVLGLVVERWQLLLLFFNSTDCSRLPPVSTWLSCPVFTLASTLHMASLATVVTHHALVDPARGDCVSSDAAAETGRYGQRLAPEKGFGLILCTVEVVFVYPLCSALPSPCS